jgi:hypothetical protein
MRDMYPINLFYLLLKMHRANPVIVKVLEDLKSCLFREIFRFLPNSMKNRNDS